MDADEGAPHDPTLAERLNALASPVRLALLRQVRTPRTLHQLRLAPAAGPSHVGSADRPISRQAVKEHLDRLVELGIVKTSEARGERGPTTAYVVDHQTLFMISEDVRELARLRPEEEPSTSTIQRKPIGASPARGATPRLILVRGLDEGRAFELDPRTGQDTWRIGRTRECDVPLDFDPSVSSHHAEVRFVDGRHVLLDVGSTNGTSVNFAPLVKGRPHPLASSDLVGVGRSLLMFRG